MSKITLSNVADLTAPTSAEITINTNSSIIQTGFDNTLSRDGTSPNQMENNLDMNGFHILNLPSPLSANDPVRLQDLTTVSGNITINAIPAGGTTGQSLQKTSNADYIVGWGNNVTSVGLSLPADFTVSNSPVTGVGTLTGVWATTPTGTGAVVRTASPTLTTPTLTTPVINGISSGTGVSTTATANTLVLRDGGGNSTVNSILSGYTSITTTASTTTLTVSSTYNQYFTGSTTQTVILPVTSTLVLGQSFRITNLSTGAVTVQSSGANTITVIPGNGCVAIVSCILTSGTTAASWNAVTDYELTASGKTLTTNNSLTLAGTDSTTITFQGTDTYVGRATTDTLTNKTFDTASTGNVFKINGTSITAVTGTGTNVLATSPTLVTPALGVATATSLALNGGTLPAGVDLVTSLNGVSAGSNPTNSGNIAIYSGQTDAAPNGLEFKASGASSGYGFRIATIFDGTANMDLVFQNRQNSASWSRIFKFAGATGAMTLQPSTSIPAGGSSGLSLLFSSTAGFGIYAGSGAPTVSAAQGSLYIRSDGSSTSTRLYVNTNGSTTWTNVTTAA